MTLLEVKRLTLRGPSGPIVEYVDLEVEAGEAVAIVGESGSGKSMTARAITGLLPPGVTAEGSIRYRGEELLGAGRRRRRELAATELSIVFQDPFTMLNPLRSCAKHITETLPRRARMGVAERLLAGVGINDPAVAKALPFELSGGMRQRVGIASAIVREPRLLIADEPTTALDATTQRDLLVLLRRLQQSRDMAMLLITHDLRLAFSVCRRTYVLYAGSLVETGPSARLRSNPTHPYTARLLECEPALDGRVERLGGIPGRVPRPAEVAHRCVFATRCPHRLDLCEVGRPTLAPIGGGQHSACVRVDELRAELERAAHPRLDHVRRRRNAARPLLRVEDIQVVYQSAGLRRTARGDVRAVCGVSLDIAEGEAVGLVGESGSGKTTIARCVVGLERPTAGRIELAGIDVTDRRNLTAEDRRRARGIAQIVFQDPYSTLNPARRVGDALVAALRAAGLPRDRAAVVAAMARVGLPADYADRKPQVLSGGERQRVAIARALAVRPRLLVCDEPVSALDVSVQAQILDLIAEIRERESLALLFVSHDLAVVRQVADRVVVMRDGQEVESGPLEQVLADPAHEYTRTLVAAVPRGDAGWALTPVHERSA